MKSKHDDTLLSYKYEELKDDMTGVKDDVKKILTNHLPHLQQAMQSLETRVNTTAIINVGAIIVAILVTKFLL